ncbi:hypothetical protein [Pantoea sp. ME81]|uniref:hypothetical protein n=1 Tax=Pantoea sp. ME81 TaxID=2743935 RepID=UPI0015F4F2C5|nr:hypothetical protein [Pantoea sp. ME81]
MSFWLLAAVLNGIWIGIFRFAFPEVLSLTEYIMGMIICLLLARVMASKADEPAGDMLFIVLLKGLIPVTGLGLLAWGTWLSRSGETLPEVANSADAVNSSMGASLPYVIMALGVMLLVTGYRILRR